jgi:hypothetical protein
MAGYRTWTDDDFLNSDDVNGYLVGQVVCRFVSTVERDAQMGGAVEGQICFVTGVGHLRHDGTGWVSLVPATPGVVSGLVTLVAGTAVIAEPSVTALSRIRLNAQNLGTVTVPSALTVSARTPGTGFTILASQNTDTSDVAWRFDAA